MAEIDNIPDTNATDEPQFMPIPPLTNVDTIEATEAAEEVEQHNVEEIELEKFGVLENPEQIGALVDSTSSLQEDVKASKSRTGSLGKMFQKMRLSEVRSKLKREGASKSSADFTKSASATDSSASSLKEFQSVDRLQTGGNFTIRISIFN